MSMKIGVLKVKHLHYNFALQLFTTHNDLTVSALRHCVYT